MNVILLIVSVCAGVINNVISSLLSRRYGKCNRDFFLYNAVSGAACVAVLLAVAVVTRAPLPSGYTLGLSVGFGVVSALCSVLMMQALGKGPISYTNLISNSSMIIPALSGWLFFSEPLSAGKLVGVALMLLCVALSVQEDREQRKATLTWLALALGAGLCSGLVGVMQKFHQTSPHSGELMYFLVSAFAVASLFSTVRTLLAPKSDREPSPPLRGTLLFIVLLSGVLGGACNVINLYLSGQIRSIIFFPTVNGANLLLMLLVSTFFFHERLSRRRWVGFAMGCVAIGLLCI